MPKWRVCGWYGHGNAGDESYKIVFPKLFPGHAISFWDDAPIDGHDLFVLGGGDVLTEPMLDLASNAREPRVAMSVSATTCQNPRHVGELFREVWARDQSSRGQLCDAGVDARLVPDFAFAMDPNPESGRRHLRKLFSEAGHELYSNTVAVVVNGHLAVKEGCLARDESWFVSFAHLFGWVADRLNASFVFVPFGTSAPWDDRVPNAWVSSRAKFWKKNCVVYEKMSPQETLDLISACDAAVTTRLHAAIFCVLGGVPFIDLAHHDKTTNYLATVGLSDCTTPYWEVSKSFLLGQLEAYLANRDAARERLLGVGAAQRRQLFEACNGFVIPS